MEFFIDKNVIMDFIRLIYFNESSDYYIYPSIIVLMIRDGVIKANISDVTPFSVGNYLNYKLQRAGVQETDKKTKNALKFLFKGDWNIVSLKIEDFLNCLEEKRIEYEDSYQVKCYLNTNSKFLITRNIKDFEKIKEIKKQIINPKQFLLKYYKTDVEKYKKKVENLINFSI